MRYLGRIGPLLFVLLASPSAFAQQYESARLLGMADAQRATTFTNDAIYTNPAGLALGSLYSVELGYIDDIRGSDRRINASVVDSQAGPIAGGLAYTWTKRRPSDIPVGDERQEGHRVELALATRVSQNSAIGVTARYLTFGVDDENGDEVEGEGFKVFTVDVGFQWRILDNVSFGIAGYNLTNSEELDVPISWGAGLGFALGGFVAEGDIRYNAQRGEPTFSIAGSYVLADVIALRGGAQFDRETENVSASVGAGVVLDRFGFDIGYRQIVNSDGTVEDADSRQLALALSMRFF